jgi:hypothetical protein
MDLNFALANNNWLSVVFGGGSFFFLYLLPFIYIYFGLFCVKDILSKEKTIHTNNKKEAWIIGGVLTLIGVLSANGAVYLQGKINNMNQKISVNSDYSVMIKNTGELSLKKKTLVNSSKLETTQVNGIGIEKKVSIQQEEYVDVLTVKCGALTFDECLVKTRESLSVITAGTEGSSQHVVQF